MHFVAGRSSFVPSSSNGWTGGTPAFAPTQEPPSERKKTKRVKKSRKEHKEESNTAFVRTKSVGAKALHPKKTKRKSKDATVGRIEPSRSNVVRVEKPKTARKSAVALRDTKKSTGKKKQVKKRKTARLKTKDAATKSISPQKSTEAKLGSQSENGSTKHPSKTPKKSKKRKSKDLESIREIQASSRDAGREVRLKKRKARKKSLTGSASSERSTPSSQEGQHLHYTVEEPRVAVEDETRNPNKEIDDDQEAQGSDQLHHETSKSLQESISVEVSIEGEVSEPVNLTEVGSQPAIEIRIDDNVDEIVKSSEVSTANDESMEEYEKSSKEPQTDEISSAFEDDEAIAQPQAEPGTSESQESIGNTETSVGANIEAQVDQESENDLYLEQDILTFVGKVLNENVTSWIHESDEENLNLEASTSDNPSNKTDLINGPRGGYQEPQRTSSANTSAIDNSVVFNQAEGINNEENDEGTNEPSEAGVDEEQTLSENVKEEINVVACTEGEGEEGKECSNPESKEDVKLIPADLEDTKNDDDGVFGLTKKDDTESQIADDSTSESLMKNQTVDNVEPVLDVPELKDPAPTKVKRFADRASLESSEDLDTDAFVSVVTWNLAEESPAETDAAFFRKFRKGAGSLKAGSDLVLISGQECENIKPRRSEGRRSREYRRLMIKMLGKKYVPIALHLLGGIQFGLFAKRSFLKEIEHVSIADVTCGIGNVFHNKGAIAAFVQLKARNPSSSEKPLSKSLRIMFVTAHMAAHVKNSNARDSDFWRISSELEAQAPEGFLPRKPSMTGGAENESFLFDSVDRAFFCGDLNYRIDLPRELTEYTVLHNQEEASRFKLMLHDQLCRTMAERRAFPGFAEGKISFEPTFKFDRETGEYDTSHKQRIPAFTDRILFKPVGTRVLEYASVAHAQHSDHRPVHGTFRINMQGRELPPKKRRRKQTNRGSRSRQQ